MVLHDTAWYCMVGITPYCTVQWKRAKRNEIFRSPARSLCPRFSLCLTSTAPLSPALLLYIRTWYDSIICPWGLAYQPKLIRCSDRRLEQFIPRYKIMFRKWYLLQLVAMQTLLTPESSKHRLSLLTFTKDTPWLAKDFLLTNTAASCMIYPNHKRGSSMLSCAWNEGDYHP